MKLTDGDYHALDFISLCLIILFLASLAFTFVYFIIAEKKVDGYYISSSGHNSYCAYAHWTWHPDELAFCSDDYNRVLDFVEKANRAVAGKK